MKCSSARCSFEGTTWISFDDGQKKFCSRCANRYKRGYYCYYCKELYNLADLDLSIWHVCSSCQRRVHKVCEREKSGSKWENIYFYSCPRCRQPSSRKIKVQQNESTLSSSCSSSSSRSPPRKQQRLSESQHSVQNKSGEGSDVTQPILIDSSDSETVSTDNEHENENEAKIDRYQVLNQNQPISNDSSRIPTDNQSFLSTGKRLPSFIATNKEDTVIDLNRPSFTNSETNTTSNPGLKRPHSSISDDSLSLPLPNAIRKRTLEASRYQHYQRNRQCFSSIPSNSSTFMNTSQTPTFDKENYINGYVNSTDGFRNRYSSRTPQSLSMRSHLSSMHSSSASSSQTSPYSEKIPSFASVASVATRQIPSSHHSSIPSRYNHPTTDQRNQKVKHTSNPFYRNLYPPATPPPPSPPLSLSPAPGTVSVPSQYPPYYSSNAAYSPYSFRTPPLKTPPHPLSSSSPSPSSEYYYPEYKPRSHSFTSNQSRIYSTPSSSPIPHLNDRRSISSFDRQHSQQRYPYYFSRSPYYPPISSSSSSAFSASSSSSSHSLPSSSSSYLTSISPPSPPSGSFSVPHPSQSLKKNVPSDYVRRRHSEPYSNNLSSRDSYQREYSKRNSLNLDKFNSMRSSSSEEKTSLSKFQQPELSTSHKENREANIDSRYKGEDNLSSKISAQFGNIGSNVRDNISSSSQENIDNHDKINSTNSYEYSAEQIDKNNSLERQETEVTSRFNDYQQQQSSGFDRDHDQHEDDISNTDINMNEKKDKNNNNTDKNHNNHSYHHKNKREISMKTSKRLFKESNFKKKISSKEKSSKIMDANNGRLISHNKNTRLTTSKPFKNLKSKEISKSENRITKYTFDFISGQKRIQFDPQEVENSDNSSMDESETGEDIIDMNQTKKFPDDENEARLILLQRRRNADFRIHEQREQSRKNLLIGARESIHEHAADVQIHLGKHDATDHDHPNTQLSDSDIMKYFAVAPKSSRKMSCSIRRRQDRTRYMSCYVHMIPQSEIIPEYTIYTPVVSNVKGEDNRRLKFLPYFGDDQIQEFDERDLRLFDLPFLDKVKDELDTPASPVQQNSEGTTTTTTTESDMEYRFLPEETYFILDILEKYGLSKTVIQQLIAVLGEYTPRMVDSILEQETYSSRTSKTSSSSNPLAFFCYDYSNDDKKHSNRTNSKLKTQKSNSSRENANDENGSKDSKKSSLKKRKSSRKEKQTSKSNQTMNQENKTDLEMNSKPAQELEFISAPDPSETRRRQAQKLSVETIIHHFKKEYNKRKNQSSFQQLDLLEAIDTFATLFCRKCRIYDCQLHKEESTNIIPPILPPKDIYHSAPPVSPCSDECYAQTLYQLGEENVQRSKRKKIRHKIKTASNTSSVTLSTQQIKERALKIYKDTDYSKGEQMLIQMSLSIYQSNFCQIARNIGTKTCVQVWAYSMVPNTATVEKIRYTLNKNTGESKEKILEMIQSDHSNNNINNNTSNNSNNSNNNNNNNNNNKGKITSVLDLVKEKGRVQIKPIALSGCTCLGQCTGDNCDCLNYMHFCTKFCNCPSTCRNRYRGCRCKDGECSSSRCPCFKAGRECDPDICGCSNETCGNMNMQLSRHKHLYIGESGVHGWGAFLKNSVTKNEYIHEYVGEILSQEEAERRGKFYDMKNCSFLFDLTEEYVIDALRKGNKSKFINHSPKPNCEPRVMWVNGDYRIGIFSIKPIKAGQELFFDYGKKFNTLHNTII